MQERNLKVLQDELIEGIQRLDQAQEPYRMVGHAVSELGEPELVADYLAIKSHEEYEACCEQIRAATTAEEALTAFKSLGSV